MIQRERFKFLLPDNLNNTRAFSYLEILLALLILSIFFLPCMEMFSRSVTHLGYISDMNTALAFGREGMEKIKNIKFSESQLMERGDVYEPPLGEPPYELNGARWRILQDIDESTDPLKIQISVYRGDVFDEPFVKLTTLVEDVA